MVSLLEEYGKRAYGLYLTNLIVLSCAIAALKVSVPWLMPHLVLLVPVLLVITLHGVCRLLALADRLPTRALQRYVFG
jgi:hypothetical protein